MNPRSEKDADKGHCDKSENLHEFLVFKQKLGVVMLR